MHMACAVGGRTEEADEQQEGNQPREGGAVAAGVDKAEGGDAVQEVTFLYKLAAGVRGRLGGTRFWGRWCGARV